MGEPLCESCQDDRCHECDAELTEVQQAEGVCCCTLDEPRRIARPTDDPELAEFREKLPGLADLIDRSRAARSARGDQS